MCTYVFSVVTVMCYQYTYGFIAKHDRDTQYSHDHHQQNSEALYLVKHCRMWCVITFGTSQLYTSSFEQVVNNLWMLHSTAVHDEPVQGKTASCNAWNLLSLVALIAEGYRSQTGGVQSTEIVYLSTWFLHSKCLMTIYVADYCRSMTNSKLL